jgi:hypothetical protein
VRNQIREGAGAQELYKVHNIPAARRIRLFLLFFSDLSAIDFSSCAEFLGPAVSQSEKQRDDRCSAAVLAVFWLFAVFVTTIATSLIRLPEQETFVN